MDSDGFIPCPGGRCVAQGTPAWHVVDAVWHCNACGNEFVTSPGFTGPPTCSCRGGDGGEIMELIRMTVDGVAYGDRP